MVTAEQVKKVLQIQDKDDYIDTVLPMVYDFLEGYTGWTDLTVIQMVGYHTNKVGVQSESLSRHSVTFDTDYPKSMMKGLKRKGRFV